MSIVNLNPDMRVVTVEKDIYVRDKYGVRSIEFHAGDVVPAWIYDKRVQTHVEAEPAAKVEQTFPVAEKASVVSEPAKAEAEDAQVTEAKEDKSKGKGK